MVISFGGVAADTNMPFHQGEESAQTEKVSGTFFLGED